MASFIMLKTGIVLVIASDRMSATLINASDGVKVGIVRYLCLKNTKLQTRVLFCVRDVDPVATVVFHGVANVVFACSVWFPGLLNLRDNMSFNFASEWCKGVAVVVMLPVEIGVGQDGFYHSCWE
jgi:hypothetical protein